MNDNHKRLKKRVIQAAEEVLYEQQGLLIEKEVLKKTEVEVGE